LKFIFYISEIVSNSKIERTTEIRKTIRIKSGNYLPFLGVYKTHIFFPDKHFCRGVCAVQILIVFLISVVLSIFELLTISEM
jgi:uncharacterized YccA/Bax inhibitor family protein